MKKKYDDTSIYFKDWTTKKLKSEAKYYNKAIYGYQSYGTKDIRILDGILEELNSRGVEPVSELSFN